MLFLVCQRYDEVGPTYVMWMFHRASITSAELESIKVSLSQY